MISVCIPTYNGEKYIKEQLDSILCQLSLDDEIIISDDSSTDKTLEIIKERKDSRIIILQGKFHSPIFNLENALKKAKGDFIFTADQDDVWLKDRVKKTLACFEKSSANMVLCNAMIVNEKLQFSKKFFKENKNPLKSPIFFNNLIHNNFLGCCLCFDRKILSKVLPFPRKIAMHDIWIGLVAACMFKCAYIEEPLILYRRHGGNFSTASEKSNLNFLYRISYRVYFLVQLFKRYYL